MAEFRLLTEHPSGCVICGTSVCARGFVDLIGEINVVRDGYEISGVVDLVACALCIEQAAKYVGSATLKEVEDFAHTERDLLYEIEMLKDAVKAEAQRHEQFIKNLYGFARLEENPEVVELADTTKKTKKTKNSAS